eukprot:SAG22_NODE_1_length_62449_cov_158.689270_26_plen_872_part_00
MGRSAGPSTRSSGAVTRFWKDGGLLCLILLVSAAVGQHGGQLGAPDRVPVFERLGPPFGSNASSCTIAELPARMNRLNAACCEADAPVGQGCRLSCDVDCITVIMPLWDDCAPVLNRLYDRAATDTVFDGQARTLTGIRSLCLQLPTDALVSDLADLVEAGACSADSLDGVAATGIKAATCEDSWNHDCAMLIEAGAFTCSADFCNTAVPACPIAGQCDSTCGFCPNTGGGHRRQLIAEKHGQNQQFERRRAQNLVQCLPWYFEEQLTAVGQACDTPEGSVPTECDAKCAVVFDDFWVRCTRILSNQVGQSAIRQWQQFYVTCTAALPPAPLLQAVVECAPPFPPAPPIAPEQTLLAMPFLANSTCNMTMLPSRITQLNDACCSSSEVGGCGPCSIGCALVLLSLLDDCGNVMDQCYDHIDGAYDGEASTLAALRSECVSIAPNDVINQIRTMREQGGELGACLNEQELDEVAATEVKGVVCEDVDRRCDALISSGILTCAADFCTESSCLHRGFCDHTCDLCPDQIGDGTGRRAQALLDSSSLIDECNPETFQSEIGLVDQACCDEGSDECRDGTPSECDGKCAVVYADFYPRCQQFLAATVANQAIMSAFDRLYAACTEQLPTEPLLRAILDCSSPQPAAPVTPPTAPVVTTRPPPSPPSAVTACSDLAAGCDVRLSSYPQGRIEVLNPWTHTWGTVCGHWYWDNDAVANIVCQRLGYDGGELYTYGTGGSTSNLEDIPVVAGYRRCEGTERSIFECPAHEGGGFNKLHGAEPVWNHDCQAAAADRVDCDDTCASLDQCPYAISSQCPHTIDQGAICFLNSDAGAMNCHTHNAADTCDDWHSCENGESRRNRRKRTAAVCRPAPAPARC